MYSGCPKRAFSVKQTSTGREEAVLPVLLVLHYSRFALLFGQPMLMMWKFQRACFIWADDPQFIERIHKRLVCYWLLDEGD
jgi:hypothetical protein